MSVLGTQVTRVEDPDLLTIGGKYVDDLAPPDAVHAVFVRSEMTHAEILAIDVSEALQAPGVAGRPQAAAASERMMDAFTAEIGVDPVEVQHRNLIRPEAFLFDSATGAQKDTGEYTRRSRLSWRRVTTQVCGPNRHAGVDRPTNRGWDSAGRPTSRSPTRRPNPNSAASSSAPTGRRWC